MSSFMTTGDYTTFPRLDTLVSSRNRDQYSGEHAIEGTRRGQLERVYSSSSGQYPVSKDAILQGYARFIAALTSETEVAFQFAYRTSYSGEHQHFAVQATATTPDSCSDDEDRPLYFALDFTALQGIHNEVADFGIEIISDPGQFVCPNLSASLKSPFLLQYHAMQLKAILQYRHEFLDAEFAKTFFEVIVSNISADCGNGATRPSATAVVGGSMSILNHPPSQRPAKRSQNVDDGGDLPAAALLHAGFEMRAQRHPDRPALHYLTSLDGPTTDDVILTYAQLDQVSTALAQQIRRDVKLPGHGAQAIIPAYMATSPAFYVSWLAVLKAGFAFCPLPVDAPSQQLQGIVEEVGASLVLVDGPKLCGRPWDAWYCDDDDLAHCLDVNGFINSYDYQSAPLERTLPSIAERAIAYVMYTSGSTGMPKGVQISHLSATCSIASHSRFISPAMTKKGFRWFQFAAPTFDPSIMEIFVTWSTGGTLCAADRQILLTDPERAITKVSATIMMATPSMASVFRPEKTPTLRHLWTMGEKLNSTVIHNFASDSHLRQPPPSPSSSPESISNLLNAYGPTECSINCTLVSDFSVEERGSIIGKPLETTSILVIDPGNKRPNPVPLGFAGELAIGGPQVSPGYIDRPEQTAKAFVHSEQYGRLYRTGDKARMVKDGRGELTVEFLGRLSTDQVKLSGRRVELGQVENAFSTVANVMDFVAVVQRSNAGQGSEYLVGCIAPTVNADVSQIIADCHDAAAKGLPSFMRPAHYFVCHDMPRSRSGKTDRKALAILVESDLIQQRASLSSSAGGADPFDIHTSEVADSVRSALADVCGMNPEDIAPADNLLSLGLDSLRAVRLLQKFRDCGITKLDVATVLTARTVHALVEACTGADGVSDSAEAKETSGTKQRLEAYHQQHVFQAAQQLKVPHEDVELVLPTTATQSGMIASFFRSLSGQDDFGQRKSYINHSIYYQKAGQDDEKVEQAWIAALSRPKILRTAFLALDDDLSPFAQCVLRSSSKPAALHVRTITCGAQDDWEHIITTACSDAEASISLHRPPIVLTTIRSRERTAYLLSLFHAIFDGGSLEIILKDVEDLVAGRPLVDKTDVEAAVYRHFAADGKSSTEFWTEQFKEFTPTPFPVICSSRPELNPRHAFTTEVMASVTLEKLLLASKTSATSPLSMLQTVWGAILQLYTGSMEVSFGSVVSDRLGLETTSCVAPTFVTVPVQMVQGGLHELTIQQVTDELTSRNAKALSHLQIPLGSLSTADGHLPYDTLLAFQNFDAQTMYRDLWSEVEYPPMENDFVIMVEIWPSIAGPLRLRATCKYSHMDRAASEAMLCQFNDILSFICDSPRATYAAARSHVRESLLSRIPPYTNTTENTKDLPLLHSAFEAHARNHPHDQALLFKHSLDKARPDTLWTFGQLNMLANNLAEYLLDNFGPFSNEPVMICMEKCPELYVAVLGILKAGAGWCPIDPYAPPARQHGIMEQTGSRLLLVSPASSIKEAAIPDGVKSLDITLCPAAVDKPEAASLAGPTAKHDPEDLAYLIFTSGTTGKPKGVPITHKSAATAMHALAAAIPSDVTGGSVRCLQFSQYTFDVFVQDLFYTWTLGGTVVSSNREIMLQSFAELANQSKATHAHLTPAFAATVPRKNLETLEVVTMIGEKLTESVASDYGHKLRAFNTYGPAEVTVVSTLRQFGGEMDEYPSSNVGIPLPSVGTYVISDGRILPCNSIGELALSGQQLSPGYWRIPEITLQKFVWNDEIKQRLYLTGDLVRQTADGTINFVGRNDDLVKLGGIRVELGEISFFLQGFSPKVDQVEVLNCKRKESTGTSVVAFIACPSLDPENSIPTLLQSPEAIEIAKIAAEHGRNVLPAYMVPSLFVVVNVIPRTASAKIDRNMLTSFYHSIDLSAWDRSSGMQNEIPFQWPEDSLRLVEMISQISGVPSQSIRPASSLTALGVDSIRAIRLVPKMNALGHSLSIVEVLKCRNVDELISLAVQYKAQSSTTEASVLEAFDAKYHDKVAEHVSKAKFSTLPATTLQESLLSESLKEPQAYWSSHTFVLDSEVDLQDLRAAWKGVASRTDALRIGFLPKALLPADAANSESCSFLQILYTKARVDWTESNITTSIETAAKQKMQEIAARHHQSMFKNPPWAIDILRKDGQAVMILTIHHSVYDGPSLDMLEADVKCEYEGIEPESRNQFRTAVARSSALTADSSECVRFWKKNLQDLTEVTPFEQGMNENSALSHRTLTLRMTATFDTMRLAAQRLGFSSFVTFLRTAWGLLLTDLLETPQVLFAEVMSQRVLDDKLENAIGPLMTVLPLVFRRKDTVSETLLEQDEFSRAAWIHHDVRPGTIKALLDRQTSKHIYPAVFAFHPGSDHTVHATPDIWQRTRSAFDIIVEHPMACNFWQDSEDEPLLELSIADHLVTVEQHDVLLRGLDALVVAMTASTDCSPASLTTRFPRELLSLSTVSTTTACPCSAHPTAWLEHWAGVHPEWKAAEIAIKIESEETVTESWTYAELNDNANRIANVIHGLGISGGMVAMCLGRSLISFAVVAGILKSGNTYLPVDESLPAERKAFLLGDSQAALIISSSELIDPSSVPETCHLAYIDTENFQAGMSRASTKTVVRGDPKSNAYLLYTSGSTGKPKGVLVSRENLSSFVEGQSEFICEHVPATKTLGGRGKYLCLASRAFDVHLGEMFLAWRHGLTAISAPRSLLLDDLALALTSLHISHASFVPSLLDQTGLTPEDAPDLVFLGVGGEKMSPKTKKMWGSHERVRLINAYGPTEATIGCCSARVRPDSDTRDIGRPLGDCQAHVLVPGMDIYVMRGLPGELCFTGSFIANGYLNRPDAKGFVDSFNGQKMYRTGDIVRLMPDDHIHFLGRKDDQVKIRGQRVELGEVAEGVRLAGNGSSDVAALVLKHPELSRVQLVAFAARTGASKGRDNQLPEVLHKYLHEMNTTLRSKCQRSLPAYMVPDLIVPLTYIPLAATSGKSDSKLLTSIFSSIPINDLLPTAMSATGQDISRELTKEESEVLAVIRSVTGIADRAVSPMSTVFEMGIDSLSAISVFSRLRKAGYDCSVSMVMRNPTLETLAQVTKAAASDDQSHLNAVRETFASIESNFLATCTNPAPESIQSVRPCLPLQEVIVAQSMHQSMDVAYVNHVRFELDACIDMPRLQNAWEKLIQENGILRTCFSLHDDKFLQVVLKPSACDAQWKGLDHELDGEETASLQRSVAHEIIDQISQKPPFRLRCWQADDQAGHVLLLSINHAIYDGASLEMMLQDVQLNYEAQNVSPHPDSMPLLEYIAGQDLERAETHWKELLQDWKSAPLLASQTSENIALSECQRKFDKKLSDIEHAVSSENFTFATLLQCAFAVAMAQHLKTNDFIYGCVLSGRTIPVDDADRILAPCITTIPQRLRLTDSEASISDMLATFQISSSSSLEFQHTSPRNIQAWAAADRPLYDCLFSFLRERSDPNTHRLLRQSSNDVAVDYALAVEFEANEHSNELIVRIGFKEAFGTPAYAKLLLEKVEMLVDALLRNSERPVKSLGISTTGAHGQSSVTDNFDEASWSETEKSIRELVSKFSGIPSKDINKNRAFIHLGVDSIVAIRFAKYLREHGFKVSSADVIRHNRLGSLCQQIESNAISSTTTEEALTESKKEELISSVLSRHGVQGLDSDDVHCYECTPLQAGMLAQSLATDGALYMHHHAIVCKSDIDLNRLHTAWDTLVSDMDILRTTFHWLPDTPKPWLAVTRPETRPRWQETNVEDPRAYWLQLSETKDFTSRINNHRPLAEVNILRSAQQGVVMVLSIHHALYDGISLGLIYNHLAARYNHVPSPATTPFFEAARAIASTGDAAINFWADIVGDYVPSVMPVESADPRYTLSSRVITTDQDAVPLSDRCREHDLDIKDVCLAAFGKALACLYQRRDVVFGHVIAARHTAAGDGHEVVGPMFNTVPYRVNLADEFASNAELISRLGTISTTSVGFQHASLADVQKVWRTSATDSIAPLIESIFVYSKMESAQDGGLDVLGEPLESDSAPVSSEYLLNFEVEHTGETLTARALSVASRAQLETLMEHFKQAVDDILDSPTRFAIACPDSLRTLPLAITTSKSPLDDFDEAAVADFAEVIRKAMADVAQVSAENIALDSSIYAFGIDSIAAIQIVSRCREAGVRLSVADILRGGMLGRICELAAVRTKRASPQDNGVQPKLDDLVTSEEKQASKTLLQLSGDMVEDIMPCLAGQEYHLISWLKSGRTLYQPAWTYKSKERIDATRLQESWKAMQQRHTILRTTFVAVGTERVLQVVLRRGVVSDDGFRMLEDSRTLTEAVKDRARLEAHQPSTLFTAPFRLRLIRANNGDAVMFLFHHAAYDAWTMPRLVAELAAIYEGQEMQPVPAFTNFVQDTLISREAPAERDFWRESLRGCEKTIMPWRVCAASDPTDQRQSFTMAMGSRAKVAALNEVCSKTNVSPHHIILIAFARAVAQLTGTKSPLFGFFQLGRSAAFDNIERISGPCVNMLPFGIRDVFQRTSLEVARQIQKHLGDRVPFEQSRLRDAIHAIDDDTVQLPFNTFVNLLWHTSSLVGTTSEGDLFQPFPIGVPTDFSSRISLPGKTAVDRLNTDLLPDQSLFVDIGPGEEGIAFGVRCDAGLMNEDMIRNFVDKIDVGVADCIEELNA